MDPLPSPPARARRRLPANLNPASEAYSTPQAALFLGLSVSYLELLRRTGKGPAYAKLSTRVLRYLKADLEAWVASRRRRNTSGDNQGHVDAA